MTIKKKTEMKQEFINRLTSFYTRKPTLRGKSATREQIIDAEKLLNVKMDEEYKEFIQLFGGAYAGLAIHAFVNGDSIGRETIVDMTNYARKLFNENGVFPEINESLVFADDGSGNPIAIESNGQIVLFDYDTEEKQILASSFKKFIEDNFTEW